MADLGKAAARWGRCESPPRARPPLAALQPPFARSGLARLDRLRWREYGEGMVDDGQAKEGVRPTRAIVDLGALAHNLGCLKALAPGARVYPVIKADAYGHGLIPVAHCLQREGVSGVCVALLEEGLALRAAGFEPPVLVLNGIYGDAHREVLRSRLSPVIYGLGQARAFDAVAVDPVDLHLKLDTGMARLGLPPGQLDAFLDGFEQLENVRLAGVMTHLSSSENDPVVTSEQLNRFHACVDRIRARGHSPSWVHAANSGGLINGATAGQTLVRPGIALYGVSPVEGRQCGLRPALSLVTRVVALRELPAGAPVGYNQAFRTQRPSRIATLPIGYGDGLLRAASNRARVLVRGRDCPLVGRVSMDLVTVDVSDVPGCQIGDEVVLVGSQQGQHLSADGLATACSTIAYEVLTNLSARVPRVYRQSGPAPAA